VPERKNENHVDPNEAMETYAKLLAASYAIYRVLDARKRAYKAFLYLFGDDLQDKA
jgi:hypothetical protein